MIPLPDLLHPTPTARADEALLEELLELSFLGGDPGADLTAAMNRVDLPASPWRQEFFAEGLFLHDLVERVFRVSFEGRVYPLHERFLASVLAEPPTDPEVVAHRQAILAELAGDADLRRRTEALYLRLFNLLSLFKNPGSGRTGGLTSALNVLLHSVASARKDQLKERLGAYRERVECLKLYRT